MFLPDMALRYHFTFVFHSLIRTFGCRRRYFRSEKRKKKVFFFCFSLTYSYLWLSPKVLPFGKSKEKRLFLLFFTHLFVPLAVAEGTSVRKIERKKAFSFVFHSLIRTFAKTK
jgi:hypothetical protein